jgi:hypothetical protein
MSTGSGSDPERALLEEGATSYVQAVGAILAFRSLVQARCREVVRKRLKEYGAALGVSLKADDIRDYQGPGEAKWGEKWASLGVELRDVGLAEAWLYHTMGWYRTDEGDWWSTVGVSVWFKDAGAAERLGEVFEPHAGHLDLWHQPKQLGCSRDLDEGDAGTFETHLDGLFVEWIALWTKVGGLKVLDADK